MPGTSYRADEYEAIVREVLADVSLGAEHIAAVVGETRDAEPDRLAIARIGRERDAALARYRRDRDLRTLERTMSALDEQEAEANAGAPATALEPSEVVAYLRHLPRLWDDAPGSRRALAESLFERVEVLGLRRMRIEPTPSAVAAGPVEALATDREVDVGAAVLAAVRAGLARRRRQAAWPHTPRRPTVARASPGT
jgi:hypothetical protein